MYCRFSLVVRVRLYVDKHETGVSQTPRQTTAVLEAHHSFLTNGLVHVLAVCFGVTGTWSATDPVAGFGSGLKGQATEETTNSQTRNTVSATRMTTNRLDGR